jgi:hypothetical protein
MGKPAALPPDALRQLGHSQRRGIDLAKRDEDRVVAADRPLSASSSRPPTFVFSPAGAILVNHDLGYLAWNLGPDGHPPVVRGIDIALVENGRIAHLYTLLTDEPSS